MLPNHRHGPPTIYQYFMSVLRYLTDLVPCTSWGRCQNMYVHSMSYTALPLTPCRLPPPATPCCPASALPRCRHRQLCMPSPTPSPRYLTAPALQQQPQAEPHRPRQHQVPAVVAVAAVVVVVVVVPVVVAAVVVVVAVAVA